MVGVREALSLIGSGDQLFVDGSSGELIIDPNDETIERCRARAAQQAMMAQQLLDDRRLPPVTRDGVRIDLLANIELTEEVGLALEQGVDGVGLYRTEFLYLGRADLPDEEAHYRDAVRLLRSCGDLPVTIRTCDLAGDKMPPAAGLTEQSNPALGLRSIRLCLSRPEIFRTQLRGLLRASALRPFSLMFPKISAVEELRQARGLVDEAAAELRRAGIAVADELRIGMMVEVPSAAVTIDLFAAEVDFFAIGTNDLVQFALGVDRLNEGVSHLYRPLHPAIVRLIAQTVAAANAAGIPVSVCGEMAGDPRMALLLLGLGVRHLSMNAAAIAAVRRAVRGCHMRDVEALATRVKGLSTVGEIDAEVGRAFDRLSVDVAGPSRHTR